MAAVGHQRAGKNSRMVVSGTNLRNANWKGTWKGDDLDTSNFEGAGWEQGTIGIQVFEWSGGGDWDAQQNNYDVAVGLYPRDDLGAVKFYENVSDNVFHNVANNRVLSAENGAEVKGKVTFSANGKSQGNALTAATGSL